MSYNVLIKVYGHVWPISKDVKKKLSPYFIANEHMSAEEMLEYENDMLRISFEGIYLDIEEVLTILKCYLQATSQGKVDYIDLEAWTLTRSSIKNGLISTSSASLNAVMDYSGH